MVAMDSGAVAAPQTEKENATNGRVKGHGGGLKVQGKPVRPVPTAKHQLTLPLRLNTSQTERRALQVCPHTSAHGDRP